MKKASRTTNTIYNFISSMGGQLINLFMQFVVRTFFIRYLGKSYLGIGSFFSNILQMLSLVELGIGSAILYKLYDPLAHEDHHRITLLMKFYRWAYRGIGVAVTLIGLLLIPFLPSLIKDYQKITALGLSVPFVFLLYLFKTASSYLFVAYKSAIIKADQKEYLVTVLNYVTTVISGIVQIISMILFGSYTLYLIIGILQVVIQNILAGVLASRMYPYIDEKTPDSISREEVREIFNDCSALFLYKMNAVVMKATDNIVLSIMMGMDAEALYSNYYIFYTTINTLFNKLYNSVSHSIGNLHITHDTDHEYEVFEAVMAVSTILGATAFVGIGVCANEFISAWIGKDWTLAQPFSFLLGMELYTLSIRAALSKYRTTMGLFRQSRLRPVMGMLVNLAVSVLGVKLWGIPGVLIGTIAADWTTFMWLDPYIVHKYGFENKRPVKVYYVKFIRNFLAALALFALCYFLCTNLFVNHGFLSVAVHAVICATLSVSLYYLIYIRGKEGVYLQKLGVKYLKRLFRHKKHA